MQGKTTTAAPILAIDRGKYKSVACVYDPATAQGTFTTIRTTLEEIEQLLAQYRPAVTVPTPAVRQWRALIAT